MRYISVFIVVLLLASFPMKSYAVDSTPVTKATDEFASARLKLDTEQALFSRHLESEKLEVERMKAWITGVSLMTPLMIAAITLGLGVWNQNQQAKVQREIQAAAERLQFELKAAEIALSANGPISARNRARALKVLFPNRLPPDFLAAFNPDDFVGPKVEFFEAKKAFFDAAASRATDIASLAELWKQLFPWDQWPERLDGNSSSWSVQPPKA